MPKNEHFSDVLEKTWESLFQSSTKLYLMDRVLLSPSRTLVVELTKNVQEAGCKISTLPQIYFAEFNETKFQYSFAQVSRSDF